MAQTFDTTHEEIAESHLTLERRLVAYLAFEEGLVPLRRIAKRLGLTSAGGISSLVARCRKEIATDPEIRGLAEACRKQMRRHSPPFIFPREGPPATLTARRITEPPRPPGDRGSPIRGRDRSPPA